MSKRKHDRADGQTSLSISLSEPLKQRIAEAAAAENRPISNWFCTHVEKLLDGKFSGFSMKETPVSSSPTHGEFTPSKPGKYLTAAELKKAGAAGAKTFKASESLGSGCSTRMKKTSRKAG